MQHGFLAAWHSICNSDAFSRAFKTVPVPLLNSAKFPLTKWNQWSSSCTLSRRGPQRSAKAQKRSQPETHCKGQPTLTVAVKKGQSFCLLLLYFWGVWVSVCAYPLEVPDFRVMAGGDFIFAVRIGVKCHLPQWPIRDSSADHCFSCPPPWCLSFYRKSLMQDENTQKIGAIFRVFCCCLNIYIEREWIFVW